MGAEPNAAEKVLILLNAFLPDNSSRGTTELCKEIKMRPATVSRLLSILRLHDFVEQDVDRKYRLGHAAGMLGKAFNASRTARQLELIHVHLLGLNRALGENVHFELLSGRKIKRAILVPGSKPVHVTAKVGEWVDINASAGGKAVLAFMAPDQLEAMVKAYPVFRVFTGNTIKDWKTLKRQLAQIRKSGIAYDQVEYMEGICAVGAPAFDSSGTVLGAVVVPVPVDRAAIISAKETKDLLKATTAKITEDLRDLP